MLMGTQAISTRSHVQYTQYITRVFEIHGSSNRKLGADQGRYCARIAMFVCEIKVNQSTMRWYTAASGDFVDPDFSVEKAGEIVHDVMLDKFR